MQTMKRTASGTEPTVNRTILTEDARRGIFTYVDLQGAVQKANILQAAGVASDPQWTRYWQKYPVRKISTIFESVTAANPCCAIQGDTLSPWMGHHNRDNVTGKLDYKLSPANVFSASLLWNRQDVTRSDISNDFSKVPAVQNDDRQDAIVGCLAMEPRRELYQ